MCRWFCTTGKTIGLHPFICIGMARENSSSRSTTEPPGRFLRVDRCSRNSDKEGEKVRTATSTLCDGLMNYQIYVISDTWLYPQAHCFTPWRRNGRPSRRSIFSPSHQPKDWNVFSLLVQDIFYGTSFHGTIRLSTSLQVWVLLHRRPSGSVRAPKVSPSRELTNRHNYQIDASSADAAVATATCRAQIAASIEFGRQCYQP